MTLKEKFENVIFNYVRSEYDRRDVAINLEADAEDFAIGFVSWCDHYAEPNRLFLTYEELLEMYKKEKQL